MNIIEDLKDQFVAYYDSLIMSLPKIGVGLLILILALYFLRIFRKRIMKIISKKADDILLVNFIDRVIQIANVTLASLLFLYTAGLGSIAGSILGAAGVSAIVFGFAFKDIGENFLAGVIMAFNRPFRVGDTIKSAEVEGIIKQMSLRETHIKTFDGKDVFVPNGQIIKNPLYNYTIDGFLRGQFIVGVDYASDLEKIRAIILNEILTVPGIIKDDKPPRTHVKSLNVSTVDIEVHYWIDTFNKNFSGLEIKSIAQTRVLKALEAAGVGMPADIVELKNYNNIPLSTQN